MTRKLRTVHFMGEACWKDKSGAQLIKYADIEDYLLGYNMIGLESIL